MLNFYGEELLAPRPTPKLEDHPLSAIHDYLCNIFAATLHIGGRSSISYLRTCHAVVTGTNLSQTGQLICTKNMHISFGCLLGKEYSRNSCSVTVCIHI